MTTPANFAVDATTIALIAVIVQLVKPIFDRVFGTDVTLHDSLIQLFAAILGIAAVFIINGVPATGGALLSGIGYGIGAGLTAIGSYHAVTAIVPNLPGTSPNVKPTPVAPEPPK